MKACSHIPQGYFSGGEIEPGTFHREPFVGGFCCGDQPYTDADVRASAGPHVADPAPADEVIDHDRSLSAQEVLAA
jgi:hypothetical protein